ncbi:hypothetical protein ZWY2020_023841 [Hordeum vulgare]|nr:hypothetical protein ZWY2020_023841 [Hordeum vulgare]
MDLGTRSRRCSSDPGPAGRVDSLSAIPDDLLLLVLACLGYAAAAERMGLLARRWRGLWTSLRDVALPSLEAALGRVTLPPPAVSLLKIRVPDENRPPAGAGVVASLLHAVVRLGPEKLLFTFPLGLYRYPTEVDLSCFHRTTSIALERIPFVLRAQAAGGEFPALQTSSLKGGEVDLGAFLSLCPYLRVLRLKGISPRDYSTTTVHSASLQELVMEDVCNFRTHRVDIVAPILKQLKLYLLANAQVSISILAPMMALQFPFQRRYNFPDEEANFAHEIEKHMIVNFSALDLDLHLTTKGHIFEAFVSHLLGLNRIRSAIRRLKGMVKGKGNEKGKGWLVPQYKEKEDAEDEDMEEDKEKDDQEYDEHNLFVVPPLQGGDDMSDDDTSEGYKESADELEGDTMPEESLVHVVSSKDSEEEEEKGTRKRTRGQEPMLLLGQHQMFGPIFIRSRSHH